jgi:hypothetical protein
MRQERTARANSRRSSAILLLVAVTTLAACDNEVVVSPSVTGIDFGPSSVVGVAVVANLTTDDPVCQEATLFYDGQELAGARTECVESSDGCAHLQIEANAPLHPGPHTIGIEVLRQKRDVVRSTSMERYWCNAVAFRRSSFCPSNPNSASYRSTIA